jgi:protein-S-isoprenylcysteine O-methyltransferase Ste14
MNSASRNPPDILGIMLSVAMRLGLAAWGWGSWTGLLRHPARRFACVVICVHALAAIFFSSNAGQSRRGDAVDCWILMPGAMVGIALSWLPAYADHRNLWTFDWGPVRYLGLVLLISGCVLKLAAACAFWSRFAASAPIRNGRKLITSGSYGLVRHPAYLGVILAAVGWALVFRSGIGLLLGGTLVPLLLVGIAAEERLLESEFGSVYVDYARHTWRLVPFVY